MIRSIHPLSALSDEDPLAPNVEETFVGTAFKAGSNRGGNAPPEIAINIFFYILKNCEKVLYFLRIDSFFEEKVT